MTHLNIQQDLNISELVTAKLIQKLYDNALSVPKPSGKNPDNAYMSGKLEVPKAYKSQVLYLAGNINGEPNASGRFADLRIDVTSSYYINFEDQEVASVLLGTVSTDGIGVSEGDATLITSFSTLDLTNRPSITSFDELKYFTNITSIPQGGLSGTSNITKINLKNILSIGLGVFDGKTWLNNVGQTTNLRTIGKYAFKDNSSLHNIDLTGVTTIELEAFRGAGIIDVNCPNLLNLNGSGNFQMSSVQTITDLGNVTVLPDSAFWKCTSLTSVNIPNIITINNGVFSECSSLTGKLNLPNCTKIGYRSLENTAITELYAPSLVVVGITVNSQNPNNSRLVPTTCTKVTVSPNVTTVHTCAFVDLPNLILNASDFSTVTSLGGGAFLNCGLTGIIDMPNLASYITQTYYPNALSIFLLTNITEVRNLGLVTTLVPAMFKLCTSLTKVTLPSGVTVIPDECFKGCTSLNNIDLSGITTAGYHSFEGCTVLPLNASSVPNRIGEAAFKDCTGITGDLNSSTMLVLNNYSFYNTRISSITNTGSVTSIPKWCFLNCTSLTNVTLSSSITLIHDNCFTGCTALEWVKILYPGDNDNPIVGAGTDCFGRTGYSDHNTNIKIFVPDSRVNDYINASWFWNKYSSLIYPLSDFSTYFPNA